MKGKEIQELIEKLFVAFIIGLFVLFLLGAFWESGCEYACSHYAPDEICDCNFMRHGLW